MPSVRTKYKILLTEGAEQNLESIVDYIAEFDCVADAHYVLGQLMKTVENLSRFPERNGYPKELSALGNHEYQQTFFKPYSVIYRVMKAHVIVYVIADERRDMQSLLAKRLLAA